MTINTNRQRFHLGGWVKYLLAFAIFVLSIGFIGEHCIKERIKRKYDISELQTKIADLQSTFHEDNVVLERLKNDPEEVRRIAREKYYMKSENEDVFIIEDK